MKPLLLLSLSLAIPLSSLRADWLNFRGPAGSGFDPGIATTVGELAEKTLAWKAALPGRGLGSPIVVGDKVFVTAASGPEQQQLHVLCFSAKDGTPLWERRFWARGGRCRTARPMSRPHARERRRTDLRALLFERPRLPRTRRRPGLDEGAHPRLSERIEQPRDGVLPHRRRRHPRRADRE